MAAARAGVGAEAKLLMNVRSYKFNDIPRPAAFERLTHDFEGKSSNTIDETRIKEHLIRRSVSITIRAQMQEEIVNITRTSRTSTHRWCSCSSYPLRQVSTKSKEKRKNGAWKSEGDGKGQEQQ